MPQTVAKTATLSAENLVNTVLKSMVLGGTKKFTLNVVR